MRSYLIPFLLLGPVAGHAQPYSESMADCAAFYQNGAQWVRSDATAEKMMVSVRAWHAAAVKRARAEGRGIDEDAMWRKIDLKTDEWEAKGVTFSFAEEFREWASYCRKFGKSQGIRLPTR